MFVWHQKNYYKNKHQVHDFETYPYRLTLSPSWNPHFECVKKHIIIDLNSGCIKLFKIPRIHDDMCDS